MSVVTFNLFTDHYRKSLFENARQIVWEKVLVCQKEHRQHVCFLMAYCFLSKLDKVTTVSYLHDQLCVDPNVTRNVLGVTVREQSLIIKDSFNEWADYVTNLDTHSYLAHIPFAVKMQKDFLSDKKDYELLVFYDMPLHTLKAMRTMTKTIYKELVI